MQANRIAIDDRFTVIDVERVMTILIVPTADKSITIFCSRNVVTIFRILTRDAVVILDSQLGYTLLKFFELRQERFRCIQFHAVFQRIPTIAPPTSEAVHREHSIRPVDRNNMFFAEVTITAVQVMFIAPRKPPLLTTERAMGRRRYQLLLPAEDRRDFFIER